MPEVSVIIPVYNGARFITEALESVQSQTLTDWELIVVDDGSTDETPALLEKVTDARIIKIQQKNQGAAAARNAALDVASGRFVGFLDADDLYLPNALEDLVGYLEHHPEIDIVYANGLMCDTAKRPLMRLTDIRPAIYTGRILEQIVLSASIITVPVCTLARRASIGKGGIRFDTQLAPSEDWDFWIQLARFAQFGYLDKLTCMYRIHETNITKTTGAQRRNADLVRGRLKVMNADWFAELSLPTRRTFFYNLLVGLLGHQPEQQCAVIEAAPFEALPPDIKADLLRQVASSHLSGRQDVAFALDCLRRSVELQPDSRKGCVLLALAQRNPALAAVALGVWQIVHRVVVGVRSFGQRKPKPVPTALLPKTE